VLIAKSYEARTFSIKVSRKAASGWWRKRSAGRMREPSEPHHIGSSGLQSILVLDSRAYFASDEAVSIFSQW